MVVVDEVAVDAVEVALVAVVVVGQSKGRSKAYICDIVTVMRSRTVAR